MRWITVMMVVTVSLGCAPYMGRASAVSGPNSSPPRHADTPVDSPSPAVAIFEAVSPAVVYVAAVSINPYKLDDRVTHVVGSGVIIDPSGLVLTNSHVVFHRQSITVTLDNGTQLPATVVGADPILDLALLRISTPSDGALPGAVLGDSDELRVGEEVFAIGNPMGLDQTMTRGIVSGLNRVLPETVYSMYEPMIQTDAPINPGNSGGPLLNRYAEVIGITTEILPEAQNIGFAIPSNLAKSVLPSLLTNGRIIRPWLGFHGQLIDQTLRDLLRVPLVDGLLVEVIEPGSPAEEAGLRGGDTELTFAGRDFLIGGDIITRVNGIQVTSSEKLAAALQGLKVGTTVHLTVFRDGKNLEVEYTLPERPILSEDVRGQEALRLIHGSNRDKPVLGARKATPRQMERSRDDGTFDEGANGTVP